MAGVVPVEIARRHHRGEDDEADQERKWVPPQQTLAGLIAVLAILFQILIFAFACPLDAGWASLRRRRPGAQKVLPAVCGRPFIADHRPRRGLQ
jgi:hypothetical protein